MDIPKTYPVPPAPMTPVVAAWLPMETAPKDGDTEILILFDSATVNVVRLCWWDDGGPRPWDEDKPRPDEVGWWSYKHCVTQELIEDHFKPLGWMPMPPRPKEHRY